MIMSHFKWNIFIPTATHYVELLSEQILHPTDLLEGISIYDDFHQVDERLSAFVTYFLDIAMQVILCKKTKFGYKKFTVHTGAKINFLFRNYQMMFDNCEFCEK